MGQSSSQQVCNNCGTLNRIGDDFCSNCGFSLNHTATGTIASNANTPTMVSAPGRRITGALASGTLIGARYNIIRLLGRGGFGAVYLATDTRFPARRVAVKEMGDAQLTPKDRAQAITNFRQEADLLSRLQHSNMPAVSDFIEEGGKAYMVMDFIEGKTLDEVQQAAGGPLDEALVMGWALQICDVLDYLHNQPQPIVFRDLKPPNIMVTPANGIKLIDFGIARIFKSSATRDTNSLGSQGYAAPEQYGLEQTDARTDIYALGATLYDLLTDEIPPASFVRKLNPQSLIQPRGLNPRISPEVDRVIITAMEIEKRQRYQSVAEMAQAIASLGFSATRGTGGMRALTGPNALTVASTQLGSYLSNATIHPTSTQVGGPLTPPIAQWPTATQPAGSALNTPTQSGVASTQQGTQAKPPAAVLSASPMPAVAAGSFQTATPAPVAPPPGGGFPGAPGTPGTSGNPGGRVSRRALLIGGGVAVLAAASGVYLISHQAPQTPLSGATVTVTFAYSTEKAAWLQPAVTAFNNSNQKLSNSDKAINVQLTDLGSVDGQSQILSGQLKPVAWSPASNLEINRLNYKWQQAHGGAALINYSEQFQPRSLVKSPLVLASWQQRAEALLRHYNVSTLDWDTLSSAFRATSWSQVGGSSSWGQVKFGQTLPYQSNSGLLTITLLAYNYYKVERGLTSARVSDQNCWNALQVFEVAVNSFGHSSGTYLKNDVINGAGPAQADVIATYENLALTLQDQARAQQHQPLLIYYPSVNILSDHPFAVLQGDWVTDEQKQAALQFRDFLLALPQQRQALSYGFRPANSAVALSDAGASNNPFIGQASLFPNHQPDPLQALAQAPNGDVIDALINQWSQHNPNPGTTDG